MALPGVNTLIKDQFYTLSRTNIPTGPVVLAIGSRLTASGTFNVVDLDPYTATNEQNVISAYGYGSQLHRAYLELVAGGATNIVLVALPMGTQDSDLLNTGPNNVFDAAFAAAGSASADIIVPWGRGGHPADWTAPSATPGAGNATPNTPPAFGFYADNSAAGTSLAARVAAAVTGITASSNPCFAVLGVKPFIGTGIYATQNIVASQLSAYTAFPNLVAPNNTSVMGLNGPYLSVVAAEITPVTYPFDNSTNTFDFGYSNGACMYAAQLSQLASWISLTSSPVHNVAAIRYSPSKPQQLAMSNAGIVPMAVDFNQVPRWVNGLTFAAPGSDYSRLTTLRIIFDAVSLVRQIALQYIGKGMTTEAKAAFSTAISSGLRGMSLLGAVLTADYNILFTPATNSAEVDLVLTPAYELDNITISVSVNF